MNCKSNIFFFLLLFAVLGAKAQIADKNVYLNDVKQELQKRWPHNRIINLVFHGHSVPAGYFVTPDIRTLQAYPHLTLQAVKEFYPYAVVNSITTAIGGEGSVKGCERFVKDVLTHHPDVLFIDYGLNDRWTNMEQAREAWETMIQEALKRQIKVILMTPTPDLIEDILNPDAPLEKQSQQIRDLAAQYQTGLVDSYAAFKELVQNGGDMNMYMSQVNHPNEKGHQIVGDLIAQWLQNPGFRKN